MELRDYYGNVALRIIRNKCYNAAGAWVYVLNGAYICNAAGYWIYVIRGDRAYDTQGNWVYTVAKVSPKTPILVPIPTNVKTKPKSIRLWLTAAVAFFVSVVSLGALAMLGSKVSNIDIVADAAAIGDYYTQAPAYELDIDYNEGSIIDNGYPYEYTSIYNNDYNHDIYIYEDDYNHNCIPLCNRGIFLYDFDFMMGAMEDSFPYFGVAMRRHGVDIRVLGHDVRAIIDNYPYSFDGFADELGIDLVTMPNLAPQVFWYILQSQFFDPIQGLGHAYALDYSFFNLLRDGFPFRLNALDRHFHNIFNDDASVHFYSDQELLFSAITSENFNELASEFWPGNASMSINMAVYDQEMPTVITYMFEEESVAYMAIPSFLLSGIEIYNFRKTLMSFYAQIQGYEHLIIDIRGNPGGYTDLWRALIMYPLWYDRDNMPGLYWYAFFKDSEFSSEFVGLQVGRRRVSGIMGLPTTRYLLGIDEFLAVSPMPYRNTVDFDYLAYGVRLNTGLEGLRQQDLLTILPPAFPFAGRIWVLTCSYSASASALFARKAKYTGFATIVGEQTMGLYTSLISAFVPLPHTGIIIRWDTDYLTDQYGRAFEEFPTMPHYLNLPGMDALETVVHMIHQNQ